MTWRYFQTSDSPRFFNKYALFSIPLTNNEFTRSSSIEIFIYNGVDANEISVDFVISLTDEPKSSSNGSVPLPNSEKITETKEELKVDTSSSGLVRTIYTCPAGKKARIKKWTTLITGTGSGAKIQLLVNSIKVSQWNNFVGVPPTNIGASRNVYSDGTYPAWNVPFDDLKDHVLEEGQEIQYSQSSGSKFNADVYVQYAILESEA